MKIRELVSVLSSATIVKLYIGNGLSLVGDKYVRSYGIFDDLVADFGDRRVNYIWPGEKDVLVVGIN